MNINLLSEEESRPKLLKALGEFFQEFHEQREDIDESYEVSAFMYNGGTARGEFDKQRRKWVPALAQKGRSNVGSTLFHRQVNTRAGMLGAILASGRPPWQYTDRHVEGVPLSDETDTFEAAVMNAFRDWALKDGDWPKRAAEFCTSVYKDSNVFIQIGMREEVRDAWVAVKEVVGESINPQTGEPEPVYEKRLRHKKGVAYRYPVFTFPYPRSIYLDKYIAEMDDQECVIVLSLTSKSRLMAEGKVLDQEAVMGLDVDELAWDGMFGAEGKEKDAENLDREFDPGKRGGTMLRWDFYINAPLKDKEWFDVDEVEEGQKVDYEVKRLYCVGVGNSPDNIILLKVTDSFDPKGEIPIYPIRALPAEADMFYHPTHAEVVRSTYAAECAIRNATVDNFALRTRPPVSILYEQMGLLKDTEWKPGAKWFIRSHEAIQERIPQDVTPQAYTLIEQLREETKLAMATDQARLGEYAGARATKYEVQRVTSATDLTVALQNAYVVGQLVPWMQRKFLEYTRAYVPEEVIRRVAGTVIPEQIQGETVGEYGVDYDLVGEYIEDQERAANSAEAMQVVGQFQQLLPPETITQLLKQYLEAARFKTARLDFAGSVGDSVANATSRVQQILHTGLVAPPQPGENLAVHLRVATAERMRWVGLEAAADERARNLPALDQYIQTLKQAQQQQEQQMQLQSNLAMPGQMGPDMGGMM